MVLLQMVMKTLKVKVTLIAVKKTKSVEWAYPTSPAAERFHFGRTGCWIVNVAEYLKPPKAIAGFADKDAAMNFALTVPWPWSACWLQFNTPPQE